MNVVRWLAALAVVAFVTVPVSATTVNYAFELKITRGTITHEFEEGDVYRLSFPVDYSAIDNDASVDHGFFYTAISGGTLTRVSGTGTWDPSLGQISTVNEIVTGLSEGGLRIGINGSGFPRAEGRVFVGIQMLFDIPAEKMGPTQTLQMHLGTIPTAEDLAANLEQGVFVFRGNRFFELTVAPFDLTVVPEPSAAWPTGLAVVFVGALWRRRRVQ